jgi:hypothetical protein
MATFSFFLPVTRRFPPTMSLRLHACSATDLVGEWGKRANRNYKKLEYIKKT